MDHQWRQRLHPESWPSPSPTRTATSTSCYMAREGAMSPAASFVPHYPDEEPPGTRAEEHSGPAVEFVRRPETAADPADFFTMRLGRHHGDPARSHPRSLPDGSERIYSLLVLKQQDRIDQVIGVMLILFRPTSTSTGDDVDQLPAVVAPDFANMLPHLPYMRFMKGGRRPRALTGADA